MSQIIVNKISTSDPGSIPLELEGSNITFNGGSVPISSLPIATQSEAEAGTNNTKLMTPLRTSEAIAAQVVNPFTYKGSWNASTNTPTLSDSTGQAGWVYRVNVAGTQNLGSGNIVFSVNDKVVHNGTVWEKWDVVDEVTSVHGRTGDIVAQAGDYAAFYDKWPVGSYLMHAGPTAPPGFLACNGAAVSRTTYAALFAVIGTTYGAGDGSTTFNLPDCRGLVFVGAGAHGTMTRANGTAYNGGAVGATRNDQFQAWQAGADTALNGGGPYYLALREKDNLMLYTSSPVWVMIQASSGQQGLNSRIKAMNDGTHGTPRAGDETRPAEIAVLVCIKY